MRAYGGGDEHDVRLSHRGADPPEANIPGADTEDLGSTTRARRGRIADVIDPVDALRVSAAIAVVLAGLGLSLAWLPALRFGGGPALMARVLVTAGLFAIIWDTRGLGGVLGFALTAMGLAVMWQGQQEPEVPRPRRKGVVIGATMTALAVIAAVRGWWHFDLVPDRATTATVVSLGAIGALGTLAVADRSRVRLRDAIRERFYVRGPITTSR